MFRFQEHRGKPAAAHGLAKGTRDMAQNELSIAEAIGQLRAELQSAQEAARQHDLKFEIEKVEVELSVVVKSEAEAGAGIKAWVFDVSGKTKAADEAVHKVKLVLIPSVTGAKGEREPVLTSDPGARRD